MVSSVRQILKKSTALRNSVRRVRGRINEFRYAFLPGPRFICPICSYSGAFASYQRGPAFEHYEIKNTQCPRCELYERHRLQYLVMSDFLSRSDFSNAAVLHFAPEPRIGGLLKRHFKIYHTADIVEPGTTFKVDITTIPLGDESYSMVYASHVLEHVQNDSLALQEIVRVLVPAGVAVLPVPVVSPKTIEYSEPNEFEFGHVRAIGVDYFDRYRCHFDVVKIVSSADYPEIYQLRTFERRDFYPTVESPMRVPMEGACHLDYVPICSGPRRVSK